ncbi:uncharacterized protein VP01_3703g2 [Puccinia sorghi]|uniref:CCHC-type domain-containing protein n=1 Tax=Puccinia sorghi TaxID=27349 RepID=A0A0L6UU96_9BASI|nr:uncharacterized protein VP01_3703g2 [Puccinia sorghi]
MRINDGCKREGRALRQASNIFDEEKDSPVKWFLSQKDRVQALWPNMSIQDMHLRILKKCGGDLEHVVKSRAPIDESYEEIINILEDITTRTRIGCKYKPYRHVTSEKSDNTKNSLTSRNKESSKESNPHKDKKCYTCQKLGHTSTTCTQKRKHVNQVDAEEATPGMEVRPRSETNITEARLMKTKPVRGKGYTAGKSNLIAFISNEQEAEILLDSGAFFSIVPRTYLQKLHPDFRDSLLPAGKESRVFQSYLFTFLLFITNVLLVFTDIFCIIDCSGGWSYLDRTSSSSNIIKFRNRTIYLYSNITKIFCI